MMQKRILVIDDEYAVRRSFELAMEDSEYMVDTVSSGEEGVEAFGTGDYSLVFLDLKMPGMNGAQTLRCLHGLDSNVPVYIITAFYQEFLKELEEAEAEGISFEVLRKPIGADQILLVTRSVLEGPLVYSE